MRLVAASVLMARAWPLLRSGVLGHTVLGLVELVAGVFLVAGLWTPVTGMVVAVIGFWGAVTPPGDPWAEIQLGTFGVALALLGPGAWSIDARLFGWKRIDVREQARQSTS